MRYDVEKAKAQGWDVFDVEGHLKVQRVDELDAIPDDIAAIPLARAAGLSVTDDGFVLRQTAQEAFTRLWEFCAAMGYTQTSKLNELLRDTGDAVAKRHCLLVVTGDTDPCVWEGYEDAAERDKCALQYRHEHGDEDGLYALDVCGDAQVEAYSNAFFEDEYERRDNEG